MGECSSSVDLGLAQGSQGSELVDLSLSHRMLPQQWELGWEKLLGCREVMMFS